ncbi:hypothetical protein SO802_028177 [Lithocarpus litseifolius]|uniref:Uncharacterized protein n=1 Tax=Lithocarpus litseifolius TaxID=425828 RepID=A0AAW2BQJ9_9ROSI
MNQPLQQYPFNFFLDRHVEDIPDFQGEHPTPFENIDSEIEGARGWGGINHEIIDSELDNLFLGFSAAIIDSAIRNLHGYWNLFGNNTTLPYDPYLQRAPPHGWCFPHYR